MLLCMESEAEPTTETAVARGAKQQSREGCRRLLHVAHGSGGLGTAEGAPITRKGHFARSVRTSHVDSGRP